MRLTEFINVGIYRLKEFFLYTISGIEYYRNYERFYWGNLYKGTPSKIEYIYFEIHSITGTTPTNPTIKNVNALLMKPHTNSLGFWSHRHLTERKMKAGTSHQLVSQYWIDLDKYTNTDCQYCADEVRAAINELHSKTNL